eukprot:scaffold221388_cov20-Prasinocladus_malaysianus.AAC.1
MQATSRVNLETAIADLTMTRTTALYALRLLFIAPSQTLTGSVRIGKGPTQRQKTYLIISITSSATTTTANEMKNATFAGVQLQ